MIYAFLVIALGGVLIGGAWSLFRQKRPWWTIALLLILGVVSVAGGWWRLGQG